MQYLKYLACVCSTSGTSFACLVIASFYTIDMRKVLRHLPLAARMACVFSNNSESRYKCEDIVTSGVRMGQSTPGKSRRVSFPPPISALGSELHEQGSYQANQHRVRSTCKSGYLTFVWLVGIWA